MPLSASDKHGPYALNECVHVGRTWIDALVSEELKTKKSRSAVPMAAELAEVLRDWRKATAYGNPAD
jgi:hypothetical protein